MRKFLFFLAGCSLIMACNNKPADTVSAKPDSLATVTTDTKPVPQSEIADARYAEMGKAMTAQMSKGDMEAWGANFADDAKFTWSAGDSLTGKAAILAYWKDRRTNVIDSITFSYDIWLPLKVNRSQQGPDAPGIWLISWYMVHAKYKNGKKLSFWVHTDFHYNSEDKIDRAIQYLDRAPINAALGKK